jgi:hypothetical protein
MPWIAAAATVAGAAISADASRSAANKQSDAAKAANQTQQDAQAQIRGDLSPWRYGGENALAKMQQMTGTSDASMPGGGYQSYFTPAGGLTSASSHDAEFMPRFNAAVNEHNARIGGKDPPPFSSAELAALDATRPVPAPGSVKPYSFVDDDPGAQFRLQQGEQGMNRAMAARGLGNSGNVLQALTGLNSDFASQEFGNSFNRLAGMSQAGQMAANQTSGFGNSAANQIGANQIGSGNAQAAGTMGQANAYTGAIGQGANWWQQKQQQPQYGGYGQAGYDSSFDNPSNYG